VRHKPALLARLPRAGSSKLTAGRSFRVRRNASSRLEFPKSVTYFGEIRFGLRWSCEQKHEQHQSHSASPRHGHPT